MGCRQAVRQRTLTPSSRGFESRQPSQNNERRPSWLALIVIVKRDSKPERVSGVKKTVRWTVFSCEVRSGYAARTDDAQRHHPASPAKNRQVLTCRFFIQAAGLAYHHRAKRGVYHQPLWGCISSRFNVHLSAA